MLVMDLAALEKAVHEALAPTEQSAPAFSAHTALMLLAEMQELRRTMERVARALEER